LARKSNHEEDDESMDDDREKDLKDDEEDDDEDTIGLDEAEEEEEDDDDDEDDEDEEQKGASADDLERRRLFQGEAEEILENLTLEDVKEVLSENDMDLAMASRLKKLLTQVIAEGEVTSMDDAWDEALERLEE